MSKLFYGMYDLANSAYTIIVVTFITSAYFANQIVGDPQLGASSFWISFLGVGAYSNSEHGWVGGCQAFLPMFSVFHGEEKGLPCFYRGNHGSRFEASF